MGLRSVLSVDETRDCEVEDDLRVYGRTVCGLFQG